MNLEEEYLRRVKEVDERLKEPKLSKAVNEFLYSLSQELNADFTLMYEVFPESDHLQERLEAGDLEAPRDYPTMTLGAFLKHLDTEDHNIKVYIDPLYMSEGVNPIHNLLTTTAGEDAMIIAPVSHNKNK